MMSIDELAARMGFPSLADARLVELAIAAALGALALGIGWLVKRRLGTRLADWLHGQEFGAPGPLTARAAAMVGWLAALLFVGIVIAAWPWDPFALLLLDIVLAISIAVLIRNILVGVGLGDGIALAGAFVALVVMLSRAVGGLEMLQERLDSVGFSVGARHFSLLSAINILLTVVILFTIVRVANRVLRRMIKGSDKFDPTQRLLIEKIAGVVIIVAAFFVGIDMLGIDLTAFAVFSGALGLAIGFGLQKTVGNLIAGIILLMDRSIKPGDVIVVGDSFGWVEQDRGARGVGDHARGQGTSDSQRESDDAGGRKLELFQPRGAREDRDRGGLRHRPAPRAALDDRSREGIEARARRTRARSAGSPALATAVSTMKCASGLPTPRAGSAISRAACS